MLFTCEADRPIKRRQLLEIGGASIAGFSLPILLGRSAVANESRPLLTGKSVIFVFQQGGPSQLETFDPKPNAPSTIRTVGDVIPTKVPGLQFGGAMSQLAKLADKLTVVHSFATDNGGHNIKPIVGEASKESNIGVHYSRVAGVTDPVNGVPTNAVLFPASVDADVPGPSARGDLTATGNYGRGYAPFVPGKKGNLQQDLVVNLPEERFFNDRKALLQQLDIMQSNLDTQGQMAALDDLRAQTYRVLDGGGIHKALDLTLEDSATRNMYDTSHLVGGKRWNKVRRGKSGYYNAQAGTIGKLLLQARRLCEAGCGFVTIHAGYAGVWDMHADGNNLDMEDGMQAVGRSFDHAIAAFIQDCEQRGLSNDILLVCCGEMGRTPRINKRGGRDHWSKLAPLLMYGAGVGRGNVVGQSDRHGGEPASRDYHPENLISTILQKLLKLEEIRLVTNLPKELTELMEVPVIPVG